MGISHCTHCSCDMQRWVLDDLLDGPRRHPRESSFALTYVRNITLIGGGPSRSLQDATMP